MGNLIESVIGHSTNLPSHDWSVLDCPFKVNFCDIGKSKRLCSKVKEVSSGLTKKPHLEHEIIINAKAKTFEKNNVKLVNC